MPKLTSVASTQKKYRLDQGRVVGEQIFKNSRHFRKMSKTVDSARVIHSNACSFASEHSCSAHNSVAHTLSHARTHTLSHTHTNGARITKFRNHENPKKCENCCDFFGVVRIPTVFVREQGRCLRTSIQSAVSKSPSRGNHG